MSEIRNREFRRYNSLNCMVNAQHKNEHTFAVLVYGHVYIIWSYKKAEIKSVIFYDFSLIVSL